MLATDDATGKVQAAWLVKEQPWTLLATASLTDAATAKDRLQALIEQATAGNEPAQADGLPMVEKDRSPHRRRSDNSENGGKQDRHQKHHKDRRGIH